MGETRFFARRLESDTEKYSEPGWIEWGRETIPSIPDDPIVLLEWQGDKRGPSLADEPGRKDDQSKIKWSLVPHGVIAEVVAVLTDGGKRYGDDNWKRVPNARTRYYDALCRHVDAWWGGEAEDPQSGRSHLAHAAANIFFLMWLSRNPKQEQ